MASVIPDGKYKSKPTILGGTSEVVVFTVPAKRWAYVTNIRATDENGTARTVSLVWADASDATDYTLVHDAVIPANDALNIEFMPLSLDAGDTIKATGSAASVHVIVTYVDGSSTNS